MPEGPEVRTICDGLNRKLEGKLLIDINISSNYYGNSNIRKNALANLPDFLQNLPCKLLRVTAIGKRIVFVFDKNMYLVSFLGLDGNWSWNSEKHTKFTLVFGRFINKIKLINNFVYYSDIRPFGAIHSFANKLDYDTYISKYGPDPLSTDIPTDEWIKIFRKYPNKLICTAIMDQEIISSVGNYLKAEILYASKINPSKMIKELSDENLILIREHTYRIIHESYLAQGHTIKNYFDPEGNKGTFQVLIYGKQLDPYGNLIVKTKFDSRETWWVPSVQK